jgi:hypothetical protein
MVSIASLLILGILVGGSFSQHPAYNENTITVEGKPIELPENASDENVLYQSEMTAKEYQVANHLLGSGVEIDTYPNGTAIGIVKKDTHQIGTFDNSITLDRQQVLNFMNYKYIQIDGHYYELITKTDVVQPYSYITFYEILGGVFLSIVGALQMIKLIEWYE